MEIYIHFVEYEVIRLVTTDKDEFIKSVKEYGKVGSGDYISIWKDGKEIHSIYTRDEINKFING